VINFLSKALVFIAYRYERYDGAGGRFGVQGTNIPLGARILAVADTFDALSSGVSPLGTLDPDLAVQKIVDDSGIRFDPDVVNAFLLAWESKDIFPTQLYE
jgi:HD-GYP domain-containing protein (c-di-GMP phosphodiesterase class II)